MKARFLKTLLLLVLISFTSSCLMSGEIDIKDKDGNKIKLYSESHALIIAVSDYNNGWPKLPGVKKDAAAVRQVLEQHDFHVVTVEDPNDVELDRAFRDFINEYGMDPDSRLIFYFAGHGHTIKTSYGEEMGYIVPRNAPNPNLNYLGFLANSMAMQQIEVYAKTIQSKHALFLFDACFSGSVFAITRAAPENISYKTAQPVRQFISSGSADETVPDVSIFRQQFVAGLNGEADVNEDGYITGSEIGEFLQDKVINYSRGSQHPQYGKIRNPNLDKGDFVFQVGGGNLIAGNKSDVNNANTPRGTTRNIEQPAEKSFKVKKKFTIQEEFGNMKPLFSRAAIKTLSGNFVRSEKGGGAGVFADATEIGSHEVYRIIPLGGNNVAFLTNKGFYLSASSNGRLNAYSDSIGPDETFVLIKLENDKYGIRVSNGNYLSAAEGGGSVITTDKDRIRTWEVFRLVKLRGISLKSFNEYYMRASGGGGGEVRVDRNIAADHETFDLVMVDNDKVALRCHKGMYLTVKENKVMADSKEIGQAEAFYIESFPDGRIALKTLDGKYLTAVGGGGFGMKADADNPGDWQKFNPEISEK